MSTLFQQNLEFLKKRFPHVVNALNNNVQISDVQIETVQSRTGLPVARVSRGGRRVYLNSSYDPETESRRWAVNFTSQKQGCTLLCGGGFFYYLKALLEQESFAKIAIFEPDIRVLRACMEQIDLRPLLGNDKLLLVAGAEYNICANLVLQFFGNDLVNAGEKIELIIAPSYGDLYRNELELFQEKVKELIQLNQVNITTMNLLGKSWIKNVLKVFKYAADSPVIRHFFGEFKNVPAVIISAGPSLEKNVHLVPEIMNKAVVFCAGSSIRAARRFGVKPHFLVAIDGHEVNKQVYGDLDLTGIDLVYCTRFYHEVVAKYPGRKILMRIDTENLPKFLIEQNGGYEIGQVASGFSVSQVCLDLAFKFGCNPIILIGQDLAYNSEKRYADGQIERSQKYLDPKHLPRNSFITKDIYGNEIITDQELDGFRVVFERMIETLYRDKATIINATEGGVPIRGAVNRKFAEVIAEYCREDRRVRDRITELYEKGMAELQSHRIDVAGYCRSLNDMMEHAGSRLEELIARLQAIRRLNYESDRFEPERFEPELARITSEYDRVLSAQEYHAFLKELQASALIIYKARLDNFKETKTKMEYDQKLLIYLNIIFETKKYLDFIIGCLRENFTEENQAQTGAEVDLRQLEDLERRIKRGEDPAELRKILESGLKSGVPGSRGAYLYLLGYLFLKQGLREQALPLLEQSVQTDSGLVKANFLLTKLYLAKKEYIKADKTLETCRNSDYRKQYCRRRLIKNHYLTKNYVAANNTLEEYVKEYGWNRAALILKTELLARMGLAVEAVKICKRLDSQYRLSRRQQIFLQQLTDERAETVYEQNYRANREFFSGKAITMPDYDEVRFKVCKFLAGELVYDCESGVFFSGVNQAPKCTIAVSGEDVLAVYNTDNTRIFERLVEVLDDSKAQWRRIGMIPVFVIERDLEQWCFISQLFDFRLLEEWTNLHYYIAPGEEELEKVFSAENVPLPNVLHGTNPAEFEQLVTRVKFARSKVYQGRLVDLKAYYQEHQPSKPGKVLVVASRLNETLLHYGTMLHQYFKDTGITSILHTEPDPYQRFTPEDDARIMDEFRPDLVVNLLGIQEEFEVYRNLNVPYVCWLLTERQIPGECKPSCFRQKIVYTGNLDAAKQLIQRGFPGDKLLPAPLPVPDIQVHPGGEEKAAAEGIGIIGDLGVLEDILADLETIIRSFTISNAWKLTRQDIKDILKSVYFWVRSHGMADDLAGYPVEEYQKVLSECFGRYNLLLGEQELQFLPGLIKREFEDYFFKRLQADWIINEFKNYNIRIYGNGWDQDVQFKSFWKGLLNPLADWKRFQDEVVRNKVNLLLANRMNNKSYLQPELIYALATGSFLIMNGFLVRQYGAEVLNPFNRQLELYDSKREMLEKIAYFLGNDKERLERARALQLFVTNNFKIDRIIGVMLQDDI